MVDRIDGDGIADGEEYTVEGWFSQEVRCIDRRCGSAVTDICLVSCVSLCCSICPLQKACHDLLIGLFQRHFTVDARQRQSAWIDSLLGHGANQNRVDPVRLMGALIDATLDGQNMLLVHNLLDFGLSLLDLGSHHASKGELHSSLGSVVQELSPYGRILECAKAMLIRLLRVHKIVGGNLLSGLLARIENSTLNPAGLPAITIMQQIISNRRTMDIIRTHTQTIQVGQTRRRVDETMR